MPDRLLVYQDGRYGAVAYEALTVACAPTRFIEHEALPQDAQVIGTTWQFVNRDGSPDRRFNNNRQLPMALYGELVLRSPQGLNIHLQASGLSLAQQFAAAITPPRPRPASASRASDEPRRGARPPHPRPVPVSHSPWEVLGVTEGASQEEIAVAYRKLAQMNHPDKVAGLAPEFRELAERRMHEINAAYAAVTQRL